MAFGSLAGGSLAAYLCGNLADMPWSWWLLLPLIVWLIYTSDHLLDARRIGPGAATPRHQFHYRHFYALSALVLFGGVAAALVIFLYLPRPLIDAGLWLGAAAALHLALTQWTAFRLYPAELVVAILYTAGVWFGPWLTPARIDPAATEVGLQFAAALFFLAAFTNLLAFSLFERETDARESPNTVVLLLGERKSEVALYACLIGSLLISGMMLLNQRGGVSFWIVLSLFCLANLPLAVYEGRAFFARNERYRAVCDAAFLLCALPALVEFFR